MTTNNAAEAPAPQQTSSEAPTFKLPSGIVILKASELPPENGICMSLYGQGGAGKTTLVADAANATDKRTLFLNAGGGLDAISHRTDFEYIELFEYRSFRNMRNALKRGGHPFGNVIIDNLCEVINQNQTEVSGSPTGVIEIGDWNKITREIIFSVREFVVIAQQQGINVFFLCWDSDEKDDRGVLKKDLAFTPALRKEYPGVVTIIGHVGVTNDPLRRQLDFAPGPRTVAKFRRNGDPKSTANQIPFKIVYGLDNLPLADIIKTWKGEQGWPANKYKEKTQE